MPASAVVFVEPSAVTTACQSIKFGKFDKSAAAIVPSVILSVVILVVISYIYPYLGNSLICIATALAGAVVKVKVVPEIV